MRIKMPWRGVAWRDNSGTDGKPRPTVLPEQLTNTSQPAALSTINSKMAGRLLAAGGIYNQNPEMFAETARKLGGEAAQGFDEVLNEQTAGSLIALSSIFAAGRAGIHSASITEIKTGSFLGWYKGNRVLLQNIDVVKMEYVKRDSTELKILRNSFNSTVRRDFVQRIAEHPDVINRLSASQRELLQAGMIPKKYSVHHKLPLDDTGTNDFSNLVLIKNTTEHSVFTTTQNAIRRGMAPRPQNSFMAGSQRGNLSMNKEMSSLTLAVNEFNRLSEELGYDINPPYKGRYPLTILVVVLRSLHNSGCNIMNYFV